MAKKAFRIAPEIKEQIINRIKTEGVSVAQAAKDHGVSTVTIYSWLGTSAKNNVSIIEHNRVLKENRLLKALIGELTFKLSSGQKRALDATEQECSCERNRYRTKYAVLSLKAISEGLAYETTD